jgi:hypothetical protein
VGAIINSTKYAKPYINGVSHNAYWNGQKIWNTAFDMSTADFIMGGTNVIGVGSHETGRYTVSPVLIDDGVSDHRDIPWALFAGCRSGVGEKIALVGVGANNGRSEQFVAVSYDGVTWSVEDILPGLEAELRASLPGTADELENVSMEVTDMLYYKGVFVLTVRFAASPLGGHGSPLGGMAVLQWVPADSAWSIVYTEYLASPLLGRSIFRVRHADVGYVAYLGPRVPDSPGSGRSLKLFNLDSMASIFVRSWPGDDTLPIDPGNCSVTGGEDFAVVSDIDPLGLGRVFHLIRFQGSSRFFEWGNTVNSQGGSLAADLAEIGSFVGGQWAAVSVFAFPAARRIGVMAAHWDPVYKEVWGDRVFLSRTISIDYSDTGLLSTMPGEWEQVLPSLDGVSYKDVTPPRVSDRFESGVWLRLQTGAGQGHGREYELWTARSPWGTWKLQQLNPQHLGAFTALEIIR